MLDAGKAYGIHMLFREPICLPDRETMAAVLKEHIGAVEIRCLDSELALITALEHTAESRNGMDPGELLVRSNIRFQASSAEPLILQQGRDCGEERNKVLKKCRWQVYAADLLAADLPTLERANLNADFLDALAELFPACEAFFFPNCGKLVRAEEVRNHSLQGVQRFIRFGITARIFQTPGTSDVIADTVGMSIFSLPDVQYCFHDFDPDMVCSHACAVAAAILQCADLFQDGENVNDIVDCPIGRGQQWICQRRRAMRKPDRMVWNIHMGGLASGGL